MNDTIDKSCSNYENIWKGVTISFLQIVDGFLFSFVHVKLDWFAFETCCWLKCETCLRVFRFGDPHSLERYDQNIVYIWETIHILQVGFVQLN